MGWSVGRCHGICSAASENQRGGRLVSQDHQRQAKWLSDCGDSRLPWEILSFDLESGRINWTLFIEPRKRGGRTCLIRPTDSQAMSDGNGSSLRASGAGKAMPIVKRLLLSIGRGCLSPSDHGPSLFQRTTTQARGVDVRERPKHFSARGGQCQVSMDRGALFCHCG